MNQSTAGNPAVGAIALLVGYWVYSSGLWESDVFPWLLAVGWPLFLEGSTLVDEWFRQLTVKPYNDPEVWAERLAYAVGRAGSVLYLAGAFGWVSAFHPGPWGVAFRAVLAAGGWLLWIPVGIGGVLLLGSGYGLVMGWRYGRVAREPGRVISAALWLAGALALPGLGVFFPSPNTTLSVNATAAANFFLGWIYLGIVLRSAARLVLRLRGVGGAARERAREQEHVEAERGAWPTGD